MGGDIWGGIYEGDRWGRYTREIYGTAIWGRYMGEIYEGSDGRRGIFISEISQHELWGVF